MVWSFDPKNTCYKKNLALSETETPAVSEAESAAVSVAESAAKLPSKFPSFNTPQAQLI